MNTTRRFVFCEATLFTPVCGLVPSFQVPHPSKERRQIPVGYLSSLVGEAGLELPKNLELPMFLRYLKHNHSKSQCFTRIILLFCNGIREKIRENFISLDLIFYNTISGWLFLEGESILSYTRLAALIIFCQVACS